MLRMRSSDPNGQTYPLVTPQNERVQYSIYAKAGKPEENYSADQVISNKDDQDRLGCCLSALNVRTAYSLNLVPMNATVRRRSEFERTIPLKCGVEWRLSSEPGEAVRLIRFEALFNGTGGCGTMAVSWNEQLIGVHIGRDSLIDVPYIVDGTAPRTYFSVLGAVVDYIEKHGGKRSDIIVRLFGTLPWKRYPHPTAGPRHRKHHATNAKMFAYLKQHFGASMIKLGSEGEGDEHLCLPSLVEVQATQLGIEMIDVHGYELPEGFAIHPEPWRNFYALVAG